MKQQQLKERAPVNPAGFRKHPPDDEHLQNDDINISRGQHGVRYKQRIMIEDGAENPFFVEFQKRGSDIKGHKQIPKSKAFVGNK